MAIKKRVILVPIAIFAVSILIVWGLFEYINKHVSIDAIQTTISGFGIAAPIFYILLCASTNIFSPLVITPFWIAGILLFPFPSAFVYIYSANLIGHSVNFLIAKKWGRRLVIKLAGEDGLKKIDQFTDLIGWKVVFLVRLLGGAMTDYISYALGFTSLEFVPYFVITAIAFFPWMVINYWMISQAIHSSMGILVRNLSILSLASYVMTSITTYVVYRSKRRRLHE